MLVTLTRVLLRVPLMLVTLARVLSGDPLMLVTLAHVLLRDLFIASLLSSILASWVCRYEESLLSTDRTCREGRGPFDTEMQLFTHCSHGDTVDSQFPMSQSIAVKCDQVISPIRMFDFDTVLRCLTLFKHCSTLFTTVLRCLTLFYAVLRCLTLFTGPLNLHAQEMNVLLFFFPPQHMWTPRTGSFLMCAGIILGRLESGRVWSSQWCH